MKQKRIRITVTDLTTGKKKISYYNPNKNNPAKLPDSVQRIIETQKRYNNPAKLPDSVQSMIETQKRYNNLAKLPDSIKTITNIIEKFNLTWPSTIIATYETFANLPPTGLLETIQQITEAGKYWEQLPEDEKKQFRNENNGKARILENGLKATNRILGYVCYLAGYYTTTEINNFLTGIGIELSNNKTKELIRYREQLKKKRTELKILSGRQLNALHNCINTSLNIMKVRNINGKTKGRALIKAIENLNYQ